MLDLDTDEKKTTVNENSYVRYISQNPGKKNWEPEFVGMVDDTWDIRGKNCKDGLGFFAIPSILAECEHIFSSAAFTLIYYQSNMNKETLKVCECLQAWFSQKVGEE